MRNKKNSYNLSFLAPVLLFLIFAVCVLLVLLYGADIYKKINDRDNITFEKRTIAQFLTTKIRQNDVYDQIRVGNFDTEHDQLSGDTLFLYEDWNGRTLCTRLYCHDGYLRELFSEKGTVLQPNAGQKILKSSSVLFTLEENILTVTIEHIDSRTETLIFSLRSHGGAVR